MSENPCPLMSPERCNELLGKLPKHTGLPFSNDEHRQAALVLRTLLQELGIYPFEQKNIALTLARICT